jgi:hypothetical protein
MRRSLLRVWLGTGVLTSTFLAGCNQGQRTSNSPLYPPPPMIGQRQPSSPAQPAALPLAKVAPATERTAEPPLLPPPSVAGPVLPEGPEIIPTHHDLATGPVASVEVNSPEHAPMVQGGGSDNDYHALTGKLEAGTEPGTWVLRYASPGEADSHGGSLALVAPQPLMGLRAGQIVRVQGKVVDNGLDKAYQVDQIQPLSDR